jgi:hypothetical protein
MSQFQQNFITSVIEHYGLELDGHHVDTITVTWFQKYESGWIVKAIVESLYRGRYKIKSVDNILRDWERLGKPRYDFTPEYERGILQNLPAITDLPTTPLPPILAAPISPPEPDISIIETAVRNSKNLNPEESAPFLHHRHSTPVDRSIDPEALNLDNYHPNDLPVHNNNSSGSIAPSSSEIFEDSNFCGNGEIGSMTPDRIGSPPVKFHLFNTLKAIVDPNNNQKTEVDNSGCPPLNPRIAKFKLPHENTNG